MKRAAIDHPKLLDLCDRLGGIPLYQGVGILETVWHFAAKFTPTGDIGRFSDAALIRFVQWQQEPQKLITALIESGWLDADATHRLLVHDWPEHCDESVHMSLARAGKLFACGIAPRISRLPKEERERCRALIEYTENARKAQKSARRAHGKRTDSARHAVAPPSPALPLLKEGEESAAEAAAPRPPALALAKSNGNGTGPPKPAATKRVPDEFDLTPGRLAFGTGMGLTVHETQMQFDKMCDTEFRTPHRDWDAVWRNWVREFLERRPKQVQRR